MIPSCFLYQITDGGRKEKNLSNRESLKIAQETGIKNVDINAATFDSVPVEDIKALLEEFDMTMCVHSARLCDFSSEDGYKKSFESMKNDLLTAKKGGSKYLMAVPLMKEPEIENARDYTESFMRIFKDLAEVGKQIGVCVTVENYSDTRLPFSTIDDIKRILEITPDLYYNLDSGNFTLAGEDAVKGAEAFLDKTVNVHLKDVAESENGTIVRRGIKYDCVALGEGMVDNYKILQLLKGAGYSGYITSEVTSPLFDRSIESVKYIRNFIENSKEN